MRNSVVSGLTMCQTFDAPYTSRRRGFQLDNQFGQFIERCATIAGGLYLLQ